MKKNIHMPLKGCRIHMLFLCRYYFCFSTAQEPMCTNWMLLTWRSKFWQSTFLLEWNILHSFSNFLILNKASTLVNSALLPRAHLMHTCQVRREDTREVWRGGGGGRSRNISHLFSMPEFFYLVATAQELYSFCFETTNNLHTLFKKSLEYCHAQQCSPLRHFAKLCPRVMSDLSAQNWVQFFLQCWTASRIQRCCAV